LCYLFTCDLTCTAADRGKEASLRTLSNSTN